MWDYAPPPKPFYRRAWFLVPVGMLAAVFLAAGVWLFAEKERWQYRARQFDYTQLDEMESASLIYDRNRNVLGRIFIQNRDKVALADFSPALITAVIAAEDARYYEHDGVDYFGIVRAMVRNFQAGRTRQGASTITQQLARNTFPEQLPPNDRSYQRKLLEMFVAQEIERHRDKKQILELYLNRVFFGSGFYGAEAAARGYFGKNAKDLTLSEAAMLAGLLKSPSNLSPWRNRQACVDQRDHVLRRALELEMITQAEYDATIREDIIVKNRRPTHRESYAADLVAQQVERLVGRDAAVSDGYRIFTTIDMELQKNAEKALMDQLARSERAEGFEHPTFVQYDAQFKTRARRAAGADGEAAPLAPPEYLQGAAVVLENSTGAILALVGGRDFQHSPYNRALQARRPPGTAFKPIVYAAAFEQGLFPGTMVQDAVIDNRQVMIGGTTGILGEWGPERVDNKYEGPISARDALVKSKNAASVRLGNMVGLDRVLALAKNAGIASPLRPFPATFLGSSEVTLMELTLANTIFPNGGWRPSSPFIIDRIEEKGGRVVFQAKPGKQRVVRATTAYEIHSCLEEVLERGTGDRAYSELGLKKFDLGGKTGTAYNFTDAWFVGYSGAVTCGVWAGLDKPQPIYRGAFSNEIALPIWAEVMRATFTAYQPTEIHQPKGIIKCEICAASGLLATDKCFELTDNKESGEKRQRRTTYFEIATSEQAPKEPCDVHGDIPRSFVRDFSSGGGQGPRARLAVDVSAKKAIELKAPTVIGDHDPYNSIQTVHNAVAARALDGQVAPTQSSALVPAPASSESEEMEVRRAEPVRPEDRIVPPEQEPTIKIEPPPPIEF